MKRFLPLLVLLSTSVPAVYGQAKSPTQTASQNKPEFVLRIQFKSPTEPDYETNSKIKVGQPVTSRIDINRLNSDVETFDLISECLMAPQNGVYPVSLTPITLSGCGCCLCGTSVLMLTPDKPYQWRVAPKDSVYYTVTLMSVKTSDKKPDNSPSHLERQGSIYDLRPRRRGLAL